MSQLEPVAPPELIAGRYRVERALGEGGMGTVYAVHDETTGRHLALKRLSPGFAPRILELFEQEYRTLASLRHPGIVEVYDFGVTGEGAFYTMEVLEGGDLSSTAPLPWKTACTYLRDTASILGVLHARRLVHRDLSPRNLWRTSAGAIKMLDFGSLESFGAARDVVGTPPLIAPEALRCGQIDQRTDVYALGALGYWFLTGRHAFHARHLGELPELWQHTPLAASSVVQLLGQGLPDVPPELDRLIHALLSLDPNARPDSTVDIIDRLNGIAGLAPEARDVVTQGYLASKAFVGRAAQRARVARSLAAADGGTPTALLLEGPQGIGRSRLLEELAVTARIAGAKVVCVGREAGSQPYAGSIALALELLKSLPDDARSAAGPYAAGLAEVSDALSAAFARPGESASTVDVTNARARKQAALAGWIFALSRSHTLALMVDDVHALDEETQALLLTLARGDAGHRICLVAAVCSEDGGNAASYEASHALRAFRASAHREDLPPLGSEEMHELLRSLFGDVPYLARLSARLHELTRGNPEHCLLIARQLIATGVAQYDAGSWTLPQELPDAELPTSLRKGLLANLDRMSSASRAFARALSFPDHGALTLELAMAASGLSRSDTHTRLNSLIEHGVLRVSAAGYRFSHPEQRFVLHSELAEGERAGVHRGVAAHLEQVAGGESIEQLRAGLHWLWAGEPERAEPLVFRAATAHTRGTVTESLKEAAPMFADAVTLLRAAGRGDDALLLPLSILAYAGYFVDRRYALQYSAPAIEALSAALRLDLAQRYRPFVGAKLAVLASMAVAGVTLRSKPHTPPLAQLLYCLVSAATTSAGCYAISLDAAAVRHYGRVLEPLSVLRSAAVVRFVRRFNDALLQLVEGDFAGAQATFQEMRQTLEQSDELAEMPVESRHHYLAHTQALYGLYDAWACRAESLEYADRVEAIGAFHAMWANQVRAIYWYLQGQNERATHFERQVELQAIQLGSAWQVESWTAFTRLASLTFDAVATKRAADELQRIGDRLPIYQVYARWMRAAYSVLRGQYGAALELYRGIQHERADLSIWPVARGWFAEALNGTGQYEQARELCQDTLSRMTTANVNIVYLSLRVEVQLALVEAGLGQLYAARARLAALMARHNPSKGPLVSGYIHCAIAQVAFAQADFDTAREELDLAAAQYAPLQIASLTQHIVSLRQAYRKVEPADPLSDGHLLTRVQLLLNSEGAHADRSSRALDLALQLTGADRGFALHASSELLASHGDAPAQVLAWARAQIQAANDEEGDTVYGAAADGLMFKQSNTFQHEGANYRLHHLWAQANAEQTCVVLVLGNITGATLRLLPGEVLPTLAASLVEPRAQRKSSSPTALE